MQTGTLLLLILAGLLALLISLYQYAYKPRQEKRLVWLLAFLRFLALFCLFILLINPRLSRDSFTLIPPNLVILSDNSSSIREGNHQDDLLDVKNQLQGDEGLYERFRVYPYSFGTSLESSDSLDFTQPATNLSQALDALNDIYARSNTAIVVLTDGNQTLGRDYEYGTSGQKLPVFPLAIGDSTRYEDLRIDQAIINKYAFLNNQFPLETYITYEGPSSITATLTVTMEGRRVARQQLRFSPQQRSTTVQTLLKAQSVGIKNIEVGVSILENERNKRNNSRQLAIEVVDEQTVVGLVSGMVHPDLGALEKAIESNEQRRVVLLEPAAPESALRDIDIFILYQPDAGFAPVYRYAANSGINTFTITGPKTNWGFLNEVQDNFEKESLGQDEEILPILNPGFSLFDISDFDMADFPPLEGELGDILITKPHETLVSQRIRGIDMAEPLLAVITSGKRKEAVLFGENIWKWRMQSYRNQGDFSNFDSFMGRLLLYLANTDANRRLTVDYNPVYQNSSEARIRASFFDETFEFDSEASLRLQVKARDTAFSREVPMLLKGSYFESDLSDLPPGNYSFTASVEGEGFTESGSFTILDFEVERQLLATNYQKLQRLADKTGGSLFFPDNTAGLLELLKGEDRFLPVQKSEQIVVSLIDFRWLLAIIVASLAAEWFIRKYNGLI